MHDRSRWIRVRRGTFGAALIGILVPAIAPFANARVTQINITTIESPTFSGASFGSVGQYERIEGIITGTVDPSNPPNAVIADIDLASPKNPDGTVSYSAEIDQLGPSTWNYLTPSGGLLTVYKVAREFESSPLRHAVRYLWLSPERPVKFRVFARIPVVKGTG